MPYSPKTWVDRIVQFANRFILTDNGDGTHTIAASPGTVTEAGTPLSAANMNDLENAVADAVDAAESAESTVNSYTGKFHETTGHKHTGAAGDGPLLSARGTFSDTTSSIAALATLTKNLPIGFSGARKGSAFVKRATAGSYHCVHAFFDTVANNSYSIYSRVIAVGGLLKSEDGALTSGGVNGGDASENLSGYIGLLDAYISGTNVVLAFKNNHASNAYTIGVTGYWEVQA